MDTYINPYVADMEENGILLSQGLVRIKLLRTMFDGKMGGILSGAGGAHCQLCTETFKQLHDVELIRDGFPINRSITSAKELFQSVNEVEFLSLSSNDRLGLTHQPISDIDIICSSPLHSYLCIFRWFMILVYDPRLSSAIRCKEVVTIILRHKKLNEVCFRLIDGKDWYED